MGSAGNVMLAVVPLLKKHRVAGRTESTYCCSERLAYIGVEEEEDILGTYPEERVGRWGRCRGGLVVFAAVLIPFLDDTI